MAAELIVADETPEHALVRRRDPVMVIDVELRQRADVYLELFLIRYAAREFRVQSVDALDDDRLSRLDARYVLPEHLMTNHEVELRQIDGLSRKQIVHVAVEQIEVYRVQVLEIVISVLVARRVLAFDEIVVRAHVERMKPVDHELDAQAACKRRLPGG